LNAADKSSEIMFYDADTIAPEPAEMRIEIRKRGDKKITVIWSDYKRINRWAMIKMGYFLCFVVAAPYKIFQASLGGCPTN
jgi:hypothetical protein